MNTFMHRTKWALCVAGALALATPFTANAATSDNERWNQGQAELQKNLPPGQSADTYRKKLEEMGYKVTSTNYNSDDYVEYEVVKGDQTWEVQIDVDDNTHKATKVDIAMNMWKTDATKAEMAKADSSGAGSDTVARADRNRAVAMRNNQYSDRDRSNVDQMVKDLEAMPVGHDKQFYKNELRKRGYEISKVNKDDNDELDLEAVKNGHSVQMEVAFDENNGKSTSIDASNLWAESESTTRTREAQESGATSRSTSERLNSGVERHSQAESYGTR